MNRRTGTLATLVALMLAVGVVLAGCGGGSGNGSNGGSGGAAAFVGTWELVDSQDPDNSVTGEELESLQELGLDSYLELDEDGTGRLMLFGVSMEGSWTATSATAATITVGDKDFTMELQDELLVLEQEGGKLSFRRGEARADDADAAEDGEGAEDAETTAEQAVTFDDPIALVDDDVCGIVATGKADYYGDPAFQLTVTDKADRAIYLTVTEGSFTVGERQLDPFIGTTVSAGETVEGVQMWFDGDDLGSSSIEALSDVTGTIEVWDAETNETLGAYEVRL